MDRPGPSLAALSRLSLAAVVAVTVVVAVGLAVGLTAAVASQDDPDDDTPALGADEEVSPYLSPPEAEVTREAYTAAGVDVSAAAAADAQRLRGEHAAATFEQRFETTGNQSALVDAVAADLGDRADALDDSHAELLAEYSAGDRSTTRLLRELTRMGAAASQHQALADRVEAAADDTADVTLSESTRAQLIALDVEIPALESPITDALVAGDLDPETAVYVQATDDAVVLATAGPTHTRQATLRGERNRSGVNQFFEDAGEDENPNALALDRTEQLYPGFEVFSPPPLDATTVYGIQGNTEVGTFVAYLDGATKNVFHEQQLVDAGDVPVSETLTDAAASLELTVETTGPTGPMRVSVTDGDDPVEGASIAVSNTTVGTTSVDGQRWVTQPLGGAEVTATVGDDTLRVVLPES